MVIDKLIDEATTTVDHEREWGVTTSFFNEHLFASLVASKVVALLSTEGLLTVSYPKALQVINDYILEQE